MLQKSISQASRGRGGIQLVMAPDGMGKTRLAEAAIGEAERQDFLVGLGRAYPLERAIPYAVFSDLLHPLLENLSPEALLAVTRGGPEFSLVVPQLFSSEGRDAAEDLTDLQNRLLWNFPPFLDRLRGDRPLLLVLEDLEWADPSSLALLHFLVRQVSGNPLLLLCTLDEAREDRTGELRETLRAIEETAAAPTIRPGPLSVDDLVEILTGGFGIDPAVARTPARRLHEWTAGNPLFARAMLESLVASGRLRVSAGRWVGWDMENLPPPRSIRAPVIQDLDRLDPDTRRVVELAAAAGDRPWFPLLREACDLPEEVLLSGLEVLEQRRILEGRVELGELYYPFLHPVVREVIYGEVGLARARLLHTRLADALDRLHGPDALPHAGALAYHFSRASRAGDAARAVRYLVAAGRQALETHAYGEAATYLQDALHRMGEASSEERLVVLMDLARALRRLGRFDDAIPHLDEASTLAESSEDGVFLSRIDRERGYCAFGAGRLDRALSHWEKGVEEARASGDLEQEARGRLALSGGLLEIGEGDRALAEAAEVLRMAEKERSIPLRARAHRTLLLLHTWTGPPSLARKHGEAALELIREEGDPVALFSIHWAMAVMEGIAGEPVEIRKHIEAATGIAEELGSPLLRLRIGEVVLEEAASRGDWNRGIDLAEESIRMARDLNQPLLLPRLLVRTGWLHLGRGELERAGRLIDEAWELAAAEGAPGSVDIHAFIVAHYGRAALLLAKGDHGGALAVAETGLSHVDRSGYTAWAVHRILPILAEAALHHRDIDRAEAVGARLRQEAERFEHRIALVWADACDSLVSWLRGNPEKASHQMRSAAERLERLGLVPDATRLRRQLAARLAQIGDREGALEELRRVHDTLAGLGADPELGKARVQFRDVGARPPSRPSSDRPSGLTARELDVARLLADRKSNKAIGKELGISHRTVGTHLSNIFRKLEVDSREQVGDMVREGQLRHGA